MNDENKINVSKEELIKWLEEKPQTFDWNAIVAYDRAAANRMLRHEWVARQTKHNQMPPITEEYIEGAQTVTRYFLHNYVFSNPKLLFINADINKSRAMFHSVVIAGMQIVMEAEGDQWKVVKVGPHSALAKTEIITPIELEVAAAEVDSAGRVMLHLDRGNDYRLSAADTEHLQRKLGQRIQAGFARLPAAQKEYQLSQLKIDPLAFLQPKFLALRTHTTEDAKIKGSPTEGDGEILLFCTMNDGDRNGTIPVKNSDMQYLVPTGYTATLLLGHIYMAKKIIAEGCKGIVNNENFSIEYVGQDEDFIQKVLVKNGERRRASSGPETDLPNFRSFELRELALGLGKTDVSVLPGESTFEIQFKDGEVIVSWEGKKHQPVSITSKGGVTHQDPVGTFWKLAKHFIYQLDDKGDLVMVINETKGELLTRVTPEKYVGIPEVSTHFKEIADRVDTALRAELQSAMSKFLEQAKHINQFILHSLLFSSEQPVTAEFTSMPGDFLTLGHINEKLTRYAIYPEEPFVAIGTTQQFTIDPAPTGQVMYKVEPVGDEQEDVGSITPDGLYKAPEAISGSYLHVKVTATVDEFTTHILVTVVKHSVAIFPYAQIAGANSVFGRQMRAGTLDNRVLKWEVVTGAQTGSRIEKSDLPDGDHVYFPGPRSSDPNDYFLVDEIKVSTTEGPLFEDRAYVLVFQKNMDEQLVIGDVTETTVQIRAVDPDGGYFPPTDYKWDIPLGDATVDGNGVVTVDRASKYPFIFVTAVYGSGSRATCGAMIIPWPYFDLPTVKRLLQGSTV